MEKPRPYRVATTITNVTPGTYGDQSSHLIAAMDAIDTALAQVKEANRAGMISLSESFNWEISLYATKNAIQARWMERVKADRMEVR